MTLLYLRICQGGGTVTQLPAEQYQSGSTPDLGLNLKCSRDQWLFLLIWRGPWGHSCHQKVKMASNSFCYASQNKAKKAFI
jgi:hypothetical protein